MDFFFSFCVVGSVWQFDVVFVVKYEYLTLNTFLINDNEIILRAIMLRLMAALWKSEEKKDAPAR